MTANIFRAIGGLCFSFIKGVHRGLLLIARASAQELPSELEELLEEFKSILPKGDFDLESLASGFNIEELFEGLLSSLSPRGMGGFFLVSMGVAVLLSVAEHFTRDGAGTSFVSLILAIPVFTELLALASSVRLGIEESSGFFSLLIPLLSSVTAAAGYTKTAAAQALGMNFTLGFVSGFLSESLMSLALIAFALSLLSASDPGSFTSGVASGIKSLFSFLLGLISTAIVAVTALQSLVTTGVDGMTVRGLKYAISGSLPLIGSTVSGALSFLSVGVGFVSKTMGAASVAAILFIVGAPLLKLLYYRVCLALCIAFLDFSSCESGKRLFASLRSSLDMMIAVFVSAALVYLMEIIIFLVSVSSGAGML